MKNIGRFIWYKLFGIDFVFHSSDHFNIQYSSRAEVDSLENSTPEGGEAKWVDDQECDSLNKLYSDILSIDCLIKRTARNTVISDGDPNSKIMIIGEAPGQEEDIQGKPFVGQSGILLNNMLKSIGISRSTIFISNIVFWRPPGNRTPAPDEVSLCLPYVKRLIRLINPEVLLLLGSVAVHALLNTNIPISKCRGRVSEVMGIKTISTYHPAYLLRSSNQKVQAFKDFLLLSNVLKIY